MTIRTDLALASGNITTPLIRNTGRVAGGLFSTLGSWRDDDVLRYVAQLNPVLGGAKQQASRATVAFYQNIARLTGQPFNRPVIAASDLATKTLRNNITSETLFTRPFVDMRRGLANGATMTTAIEAGARRANQLAQTEVQLAKRQVGYKVRQANQNIVGYIRTLTGSENCALCYVASTQRYHKGDLLPIHPGCDCGEMPLYGTDDPGQVIDQQRLDATHENVLKRFGESDKSARSIDYRNIMVSNHGEMGPTLTWKKHNSATLADLGTDLPALNPTLGEALDAGPVQTPFTVVLERLNKFQSRALNRYTGSGYRDMNEYLRSGRRSVGSDLVDHVENLESAFEKSKLTKDTVVYRNVDRTAFGLKDVDRMDVPNMMKKFEGQTIVDEGFMSTSSQQGLVAVSQPVQMKIKAPEGTPALDIEGMDEAFGTSLAYEGEKEILFAPGTRLRIDKVTHIERDVVSVEATIVKASE
jgi:hypothetical protein